MINKTLTLEIYKTKDSECYVRVIRGTKRRTLGITEIKDIYESCGKILEKHPPKEDAPFDIHGSTNLLNSINCTTKSFSFSIPSSERMITIWHDEKELIFRVLFPIVHFVVKNDHIYVYYQKKSVFYYPSMPNTSMGSLCNGNTKIVTSGDIKTIIESIEKAYFNDRFTLHGSDYGSPEELFNMLKGRKIQVKNKTNFKTIEL